MAGNAVPCNLAYVLAENIERQLNALNVDLETIEKYNSNKKNGSRSIKST